MSKIKGQSLEVSLSGRSTGAVSQVREGAANRVAEGMVKLQTGAGFDGIRVDRVASDRVVSTSCPPARKQSGLRSAISWGLAIPMGLFAFSSCAPAVYSSSLTLGNIPGVTYSGPLVITKGGTYSGNWESQDASVPVIRIQTSDPVIIENSNIRGRGDLISGFGNRLTVRNVKGYGLNPNRAGWTVGKFVNAEEFINVRVENSYAENTIGLYFRDYRGNAGNGDTIVVSKNVFRNINGMPSVGVSGYNLDYSDFKAHAIMLNNVIGLPNAEIAWNQIINEPRKSLVEENINLYSSGGKPGSPILIHDNYIQGAYSTHPESQKEFAGGGIIVGDGASYQPDGTGYTRVYNNQIVGTTNQGIGIAGGNDNRVYNNRVVSSGLLVDGVIIIAQNVGVYLWNSGTLRSGDKPNFSNNSVENNYVVWMKSENGKLINNPWWFPDCDSKENRCGGNISTSSIEYPAELHEYDLWLEKLKKEKISIGYFE